MTINEWGYARIIGLYHSVFIYIGMKVLIDKINHWQTSPRAEDKVSGCNWQLAMGQTYQLMIPTTATHDANDAPHDATDDVMISTAQLPQMPFD